MIEKIKEKLDYLVFLIISIFVSTYFYFSHSRPGIVETNLDEMWFNFGVFLPYLAVLFFIGLKKHKDVKIDET